MLTRNSYTANPPRYRLSSAVASRKSNTWTVRYTTQMVMIPFSKDLRSSPNRKMFSCPEYFTDYKVIHDRAQKAGLGVGAYKHTSYLTHCYALYIPSVRDHPISGCHSRRPLQQIFAVSTTRHGLDRGQLSQKAWHGRTLPVSRLCLSSEPPPLSAAILQWAI